MSSNPSATTPTVSSADDALAADIAAGRVRVASPQLDRPLHPDVATALLAALGSFPYSGSVELPHLDWTTSEGITATDVLRGIRDLATEVRRASDQASDTALRLQHLERDLAGVRRLLGLEFPPQRYIISAPDEQALRETAARLRAQ